MILQEHFICNFLFELGLTLEYLCPLICLAKGLLNQKILCDLPHFCLSNSLSGNSSNTLPPWAHSQLPQHTHSPCNALLPNGHVDLWRTFVLVVWLSKGLSSDSGEQVLCKMIWKFPAPHSPWQSASYSGFTWCSGTEGETLQIG